MSDDWRPTIQCVAAVDRDRVALALADLEYDDPFSVVLLYDRLATEPDPQPWGRIDVPREVTAICPFDPSGAAARAEYAILSNEGDVYLTATPDGRVSPEKIPGAGVLSADADGRGALYGLAVADGLLHACGTGGQVHRRSADGRWSDISPPLSRHDGYDAPAFARLVPLHGGGVAVLGGRRPESGATAFGADPAFKADMTAEEFMALFQKHNAASGTGPTKAAGYVLRGDDWREIAVDAEGSISDAGIGPGGKLMAVTDGGALLEGGAEEGLRDLLSAVDRHAFTALEPLGAATNGQPVLASLHALHRFDGHLLHPLRPVVGAERAALGLNPVGLASVEGGFLYADANLSLLFRDADGWRELSIPPALTERTYAPRG